MRSILRFPLVLLLASSTLVSTGDAPPAAAATNPITHVVVIVLENRTFDNVLGYMCYLRSTGARNGNACNGATSGTRSDGQTVPLVAEPNVRPDINHSHESQVKAMDGGKMDRFDLVLGCNATTSPCLSQFKPDGTGKVFVPNTWNYASRYAIADHVFEPFTASSWGAHLELAAGTIQKWHGNNPRTGTSGTTGKGWGCNSLKDATWDATTTSMVQYPACVPDDTPNDGDLYPYKTPSAPYTPTIMDRLAAVYPDSATQPAWKIYVQSLTAAWSICATFYECWAAEAGHKTHVVNPDTLPIDASGVNGATLPPFSFVIPKNFNSMHPSFSAADGDNWMASMVDPILQGPQANSTAIFVVWDDCACIYDHVNPLQYNVKWGPRVPLLIISPYAKAGYVSHTPTTFAGILAYAEHTLGLQPLGPQDTAAYNDTTGAAWFQDAFDYTQAPISPPAMQQTTTSSLDRDLITTLAHHRWS